ncbi:hypothetical protein [Brevibacillus laterosporus]|uniref:hypothetical protein n=1 Tax=Brevibacillus laterosporus TaxID=1465 RepID=UPI003D1F4FF4
MQTPIYLHDWSKPSYKGQGLGALARDFEIDMDFLDSNVEILLASYTYADYTGSAFVLFRNKKDGLYYEVNGSHCSCYGLENQWKPEKADLKELYHRVTVGTFGTYDDTDNECC